MRHVLRQATHGSAPLAIARLIGAMRKSLGYASTEGILVGESTLVGNMAIEPVTSTVSRLFTIPR